MTSTRNFDLSTQRAPRATTLVLLWLGLFFCCSFSTAAGQDGDAESPLAFTALAIDSLDPAIRYAGTSGQGILKTTNGGDTWTPARAGLPAGVEILALAVDPAKPAVLYAGTHGHGVYKSLDGGDSWRASGLTAHRIWTLAVDPADPAIVHAGAVSEGLFRSADGGLTWSPDPGAALGGMDVLALASHPWTGELTHVGTATGGLLARAEAREETSAKWRRVDLGPGDFGVWSLAVDPRDPATLYAGTLREGLFKSMDHGVHWQRASHGLPAFSDVFDVAIDPHDTARLYVATQNGLYKSTDAAKTWRPTLRYSQGPTVLALAIDLLEPRNLLAGTLRHGLLETRDGGLTWRRSLPGHARRAPATGENAEISPAARLAAKDGASRGGMGRPKRAAAVRATVHAELMIYELDVNQPGIPDAGEFVELKNSGDAPLRLSEYQLVHLAYNWWSLLLDRRLTLPDVTLAPGDLIVLCRDAARVPGCDEEILYDLNDANGVVAVVHRPEGDPAAERLVDSFVYMQYYAHGLPPGPRGEEWTEGPIMTVPDGSTAVLAPEGFGYSRSCASGEIRDTNDNAADFRLLPVTPGQDACVQLQDPGDEVFADRVCLGFSWGCAAPQGFSVTLGGRSMGSLPLGENRDPAFGESGSTFCVSSADLPDGIHELELAVDCGAHHSAASTPVRVANTPFRLVRVEADHERYRAHDEVRISVELSRAIGEVTADFSQLDSAFDPSRMTVRDLGDGHYEIVYALPLFLDDRAPGVYSIPIELRDGAVTRIHEGLRVGYVGETDNLLRPVDAVPTRTVTGRMPGGVGSAVILTSLEADRTSILPMTTIVVSGTIDAPFIAGQPRAAVEAAARGYSLLWREYDGASAGAYFSRPLSLDFECDPKPPEICRSGAFEVELGFPLASNARAKDGAHRRALSFTVRDPDGETSNSREVEVHLLVLDETAVFGHEQDAWGFGPGAPLELEGEFQLGPPMGNPVSLVLTWDGEDGPGASPRPSDPGLPPTLDALDLNIGLRRAPHANLGRAGWWGHRSAGLELIRKSNTCMSGRALGQPGPDREFCACTDASEYNMEIMTFQPGSDLGPGWDDEGTLRAEYYVYDSCGSKRDTIATMTAYYCGIVEQHRFHVPAELSEENMDLSQNWGADTAVCGHGTYCFNRPRGECCHEPKRVPTGFNETGGYYKAFDFNPSHCSSRPVVRGQVEYEAPVLLALNDPGAAQQHPNPRFDTAWRHFEIDTAVTGWKSFAAPWVRIEVRLVDGTRELVAETHTNEEGEFELLLPASYAENGETGLVRIDAVAVSAPPFDIRVVEDLDANEPHRVTLASSYDPRAGTGQRIDGKLNGGPGDEDGKEPAAAFHILRNSLLAAQWIFDQVGELTAPYTVLYDRDAPFLNAACQLQGSFYNPARGYTHFQSQGNGPAQVCPVPLVDGKCPVECQDDPSGARISEKRADFSYDTHLHEFVHHFTSTATSIEAQVDFPGERATGSHYGNSSQKTSLTEGIATALGGVLSSALIYEVFEPGKPMIATRVICNGDDLPNCSLAQLASLDWLTNLDREGPDWQPQKDCPPGDPGCGCLLGACNEPGYACGNGYCVNGGSDCGPAGSQGCTSRSRGPACDSSLTENDGFCVLPVTYSDGWTWRLLWDLLDEGEDVQPETSHWRTSQMSDASPDVGPLYDTFGGVEAFLEVLMRHFGNEAPEPLPSDMFHPNLADFLDRWRCEVGESAGLSEYLAETVEFPYHDPEGECP